jgi:hypothetical protein
MPLPAGWTDNGAALYGPAAPDGHIYYFSDASGMRGLAKQLLLAGILEPTECPHENAAQVNANRVEQATAYHLLVIARKDTVSPWSGFISNLGDGYMRAANRSGHPATIPTLPAAPKIPVSPKLRIIPCLNKYGVGISEFTPGDHLNTGRCNWASLAVALAATEGIAPSHDRMVFLANDAYSKGYCDAENKAAKISQVAAYTRKIAKKRILKEWDYQEPFEEDWWGLLTQYAGINPIVLQIANGSGLIDIQTGVRDEAFPVLRYHTIAVVGMWGSTPICCDPDHPQVTSRFQVYNRATLQAARPCGLLMLAIP